MSKSIKKDKNTQNARPDVNDKKQITGDPGQEIKQPIDVVENSLKWADVTISPPATHEDSNTVTVDAPAPGNPNILENDVAYATRNIRAVKTPRHHDKHPSNYGDALPRLSSDMGLDYNHSTEIAEGSVFILNNSQEKYKHPRNPIDNGDQTIQSSIQAAILRHNQIVSGETEYNNSFVPTHDISSNQALEIPCFSHFEDTSQACIDATREVIQPHTEIIMTPVTADNTPIHTELLAEAIVTEDDIAAGNKAQTAHAGDESLIPLQIQRDLIAWNSHAIAMQKTEETFSDDLDNLDFLELFEPPFKLYQ
ncbi:unnamed protein product [Orchesella dallaii]|uniref:Uncharacterized protein n=1 Tax=Orchesella dallaii TaxID=48710 RepID=A0ABP1RPM9_9HEXA